MPSVHHKFDSFKYFTDRVVRDQMGNYMFRGVETNRLPESVFKALCKSKSFYAARRILREHYADCQIRDAFPEVWIHCHNFDNDKNRVQLANTHIVKKHDTPFTLTRREMAKSSIV